MISPHEFIARQDRLLAQCAPQSVCLIPANSLVTRSRDTEYLFRQDSDFWYLTGFGEPEGWLLLSNHSRHPGNFRAMICQPKDETAEIWQGRRLGAEAALTEFSLDEAYELDETQAVLREWLQGHSHVYFALGHNAKADALVLEALEQLRNHGKENIAPASLQDIRPLIHEMRVFKSAAEVATMKAAAKISARAHCRAMTFAHSGCYEYQLEAELHHEFAMAGARSAAYSTIVGSGENACILHYTENSKQITDGDLVLIDSGAEYLGYAADITRTFPVNGKFSAPQAKLYQLVLDAQLAAIEVLKPGATLTQAMQVSVEIITKGLIELNILTGNIDDNLQQQSWRKFFMHGIGHYLGLDVHDVGDYKRQGEDRPLQPGMVLTIEPGVYIAADAAVPQEYRGMGIRIEDNLVIVAEGAEVITSDAPKNIKDIETLMRK